ncbi:MAG: tRNA 2-thiouridine(34) synthase MnmA, partial [Calditrichaeota bacterium]|nr:tRNA 2-thiouridine(34) synthase MnmA [Calditrichota bacterium]
LDSVYDCRMVCGKLNIPFFIVDFSDTFKETVIENFKSEYLNGRTPNPCVLCNTKIKWETFLNKCREFGADYIATGHYAKIVNDPDTNRYSVQQGDYSKKDQSYALWGLSQDALAHTLLPLGSYTKPEVREIAAKYGFRTAHKAESMEICFVKDNNYHRFLKDAIPELEKQVKDGAIIDKDGKFIKKSDGYPFYTIGQRKGLGGGYNEPMYVVNVDAKANTVTVGSKSDLFSDGLVAEQVNFQKIDRISKPMRAFVKIRYNDQLESATIEQIDDQHVKINFDKPRLSVSPGQSTVFYDENKQLIGGGIIQSGFKISHVNA